MLVATVVALTGVIYGAEVFMERRVAVASHIDPGGGSRGVMTKAKRKGSLADAVQVRPAWRSRILLVLGLAW